MHRLLALLATVALTSSATAQTTIAFWHSMEGIEDAVDALVERFHASQDDVRVEAADDLVGSAVALGPQLVDLAGHFDERRDVPSRGHGQGQLGDLSAEDRGGVGGRAAMDPGRAEGHDALSGGVMVVGEVLGDVPDLHGGDG